MILLALPHAIMRKQTKECLCTLKTWPNEGTLKLRFVLLIPMLLWLLLQAVDCFRDGQEISIHSSSPNCCLLWPRRSEALTYFHALTGCDTVSFFGQPWKEVRLADMAEILDATAVFQRLSAKPAEIPADAIAVLERFVVLLYDSTCTLEGVDKY